MVPSYMSCLLPCKLCTELKSAGFLMLTSGPFVMITTNSSCPPQPCNHPIWCVCTSGCLCVLHTYPEVLLEAGIFCCKHFRLQLVCSQRMILFWPVSGTGHSRDHPHPTCHETSEALARIASFSGKTLNVSRQFSFNHCI